jgi:hypothetical protein
MVTACLTLSAPLSHRHPKYRQPVEDIAKSERVHHLSSAEQMRSFLRSSKKSRVSDRKGKPVFAEWKLRPDAQVSNSVPSPMSHADLEAILVPSAKGRILQPTC